MYASCIYYETGSKITIILLRNFNLLLLEKDIFDPAVVKQRMRVIIQTLGSCEALILIRIIKFTTHSFIYDT